MNFALKLVKRTQWLELNSEWLLNLAVTQSQLPLQIVDDGTSIYLMVTKLVAIPEEGCKLIKHLRNRLEGHDVGSYEEVWFRQNEMEPFVQAT